MEQTLDSAIKYIDHLLTKNGYESWYIHSNEGMKSPNVAAYRRDGTLVDICNPDNADLVYHSALVGLPKLEEHLDKIFVLREYVCGLPFITNSVIKSAMLADQVLLQNVVYSDAKTGLLDTTKFLTLIQEGILEPV